MTSEASGIGSAALRGRAQRDPPSGLSRQLASITSPLLLVPSDHQVSRLIESLMNLTLPSVIMTLTPPE